ncbi:uncharacterized protein BO95DRAFT_471004 [Aspergillus brunneoviolaceus CBS 621.78]|uniref:Uncharacterized protein n=1 Tax=Aspergillus brunneoviolaceus CBS 621.78 TaxID=1450534 RepID=A0ACD1GJM9_9EURO|nr:hypothetical protein BO95DRAFT_471004 [Aspergillus brunneoviolaceus CBS 621.78]RAH49433.1 hypothetical protein BO95DRAFT_471004 [Aspergillus brunneoviolaceus CBS 621.78]
MSCLSGIRLRHHFERSSLPNITHAPRAPWKLVGPASAHLQSELETLYWYGVRLELENTIRTLKTWQQSEYTDVAVDDEHDNNLHGFDTFIDQVTQETRAFAIRYGEEKTAKTADQDKILSSVMNGTEIKEALRKTKLAQVEYQSTNVDVKDEVRRNMEDIVSSSGIQERARILLQAAGLLDIDKLIEHRPPLEDLGFWARPAIPQLTLSGFDSDWNARLEPLKCSDCSSIIRGSMFTHSGKSNHAKQLSVCEDCYRKLYLGREQYVKAYKHCVLAEAITPALSRNICHCADVSRLDSTGLPGALFPISKGERHVAIPLAKRCKLLELNNRVALAKYHGLQSTVRDHRKKDKKMTRFRVKSNGTAAQGIYEPARKVTLKGESDSKQPPLRPEPEKEVPFARDQDTNTASVKEAMADEDIPLFFRQFAQQYPFGNVHMALRVGPLVIENGVANTKQGALVTIRELPTFHDRPDSCSPCSRHPSLAIGGDTKRRLWQQQRLVETPKRYKAIMKQVVGVPFTGAISGSSYAEQESGIIWLIVAASRGYFDHPGLPVKEQRKSLDAALDQIIAKLKALLETRVNIYLRGIAKKLLDPSTTLTWSAIGNNCQSFCDSLIDTDSFEPLIERTSAGQASGAASPLYLMSFVCPQDGYLRSQVRTKYDVPRGLTEEYLLRFHFGRHDEADVLDTLQEYWYDWGAFGGTLYKYQDLFPWDCTEAYQQHPKFCGSCNLAKHIWAFPFDAWSLIALHLQRGPQMYATAKPSNRGMEDVSWMRDRLTVLTALSLLNRGATAMARSEKFVQATQWLHSADKGPRQAHPSLTRVKLGGIHRAQPYSHYYEAGTYSHYFLAKWASRPRPEQIQEYEVLRNERARRPDVGGSGRGGRFSLPRTENAREGPTNLDFLGFEGLLYDLDRLHTNDSVDESCDEVASTDADYHSAHSAHSSPGNADGDFQSQPSSGSMAGPELLYSSHGVPSIDDSQQTKANEGAPVQEHRDTTYRDTVHPNRTDYGAGDERDVQSTTRDAGSADKEDTECREDSSKQNQSGVNDGGPRASYQYDSTFATWKGHSKYQHPGHVDHTRKTDSGAAKSTRDGEAHTGSGHGYSSTISSGYGSRNHDGWSSGYTGGWNPYLSSRSHSSGSSYHGSNSSSSYGGGSSSSYSSSSAGGSSSCGGDSSSSSGGGGSSDSYWSSSYDSGSSYSSSWN